MNALVISIVMVIWAVFGLLALFVTLVSLEEVASEDEIANIKKHKLIIASFLLGPVTWCGILFYFFHVVFIKRLSAWLIK